MLKLKKIRIQHFKSIQDLTLDLSDDVDVLIGANGSGKSSVLQCLSFINFFIQGETDNFFSDRAWEPSDIRHRNFGSRTVGIGCELLLKDGDGNKIFWSFVWQTTSGRTASESIWFVPQKAPPFELVSFSSKTGLKFGGETFEGPPIKPTGSTLAWFVLEGDEFAPLASLEKWARSIMSLELMNPASLRRSSRISENDIGLRGERLSGFLDGLTVSQKQSIGKRLNEFYENGGVKTKRKKAGWVDYQLNDNRANFDVAASHISDGVLRLLAFCSLPEIGDAKSLILIDEIEDGIEPHFIPRLINMLRDEVEAQVVLTSHSPLVVNQMEQEAVHFVARDSKGCARAVKISDMKLFSESSDYFGPGELWLTSSLPTMQEQALAVREQSEEPRSAYELPTLDFVASFSASR